MESARRVNTCNLRRVSVFIATKVTPAAFRHISTFFALSGLAIMFFQGPGCYMLTQCHLVFFALFVVWYHHEADALLTLRPFPKL